MKKLSSIFTTLGSELLDREISVIPIKPKGKRPAIFNNKMNKWELLKGWNYYTKEFATEKEIEAWGEMPNPNIGVCLGKISNIIGLDFDYHEELHNELIESIPPSPLIKVGAKGSTHFYKYNDEKSRQWKHPKSKKIVVELLSTGKQTVIPPSIHPDGMEYKWTSPYYLDSIDFDMIPDLPKDIEERFNKIIGIKKISSNSSNVLKDTDVSIETINRALLCINADLNYIDWLRVGLALHSWSNGSQEGFKIWNEWSKTGEKYNEDEMSNKWSSFGKNSGITIASFFYIAKESGFKFNKKDFNEISTENEEDYEYLINDIEEKITSKSSDLPLKDILSELDLLKLQIANLVKRSKRESLKEYFKTIVQNHFKEMTPMLSSTWRKEISTCINDAGEKDQKYIISYEDHIDFIISLKEINELKRDILSDEVITQTPQDYIIPALNKLDYIKGHALTYETKDGGICNPSAFEPYLERYKCDELVPELLLDIPNWDKIDRLKEIFIDTVTFHNIKPKYAYELFCEWGANIFRRLNDPYFQPICPLLVGSQGCGKDQLILSLVGGLNFYFKNLDLGGFQLDEAELMLHTALVFNLSEFERAQKHSAQLKNLITTPFTNKRLKYDKKDQMRYVRASFIASSNSPSALQDVTGERRIWLFDCKFVGFEMEKHPSGRLIGNGKIVKDYPGLFNRKNKHKERLQILAQFKYLFEDGFKASESAKITMREYVDSQTPVNPEIAILEDFDNEIRRKKIEADKIGEGNENLYFKETIQEVLRDITYKHESITSENYLLKLLAKHQRKYRKRVNNKYVYISPLLI